MGSGSYPQIWHMQEKIDHLSSSNQQQLEDNHKLEAELQQVQESTEAVEARARNDFGMIKKGETFYQIILSPEQSAPVQAEGDTTKEKITPVLPSAANEAQ